MDFSTQATSVTTELRLELIDRLGDATAIDAELCYAPGDPFAVTAVFRAGPERVRWQFGRELLEVGLCEPVGDGDVHVWPCLDEQGHAVVMIELCSPHGQALIQARTRDVVVFVERMRASVPSGSEAGLLDLDAVVAALLDSSPR